MSFDLQTFEIKIDVDSITYKNLTVCECVTAIWTTIVKCLSTIVKFNKSQNVSLPEKMKPKHFITAPFLDLRRTATIIPGIHPS